MGMFPGRAETLAGPRQKLQADSVLGPPGTRRVHVTASHAGPKRPPCDVEETLHCFLHGALRKRRDAGRLDVVLLITAVHPSSGSVSRTLVEIVEVSQGPEETPVLLSPSIV